MSVDPISLVVAISALILGLWNHVKSSKCGACKIEMVDSTTDAPTHTDHTTIEHIIENRSQPIPIPSRIPVFSRKSVM